MNSDWCGFIYAVEETALEVQLSAFRVIQAFRRKILIQ